MGSCLCRILAEYVPVIQKRNISIIKLDNKVYIDAKQYIYIDKMNKKIPPVCMKCKTEMEWIMNNSAVYTVVEGLGHDNKLDHVEVGEKYKCKKCGATVITDIPEKFRACDYDQKFLKALLSKTGEYVKIH